MDNILFIPLSPKGKNSFSYQIFENLKEYGLNGSFFDGKDNKEEINKSLEKAEGVIISYPLYVDTLPSYTTSILEKVEKQNGKSLYIIVNCGFPEAFQNRVSIEIMKEFAREKGFDFKGFLSIGMGPFVTNIKKDSVMYKPIEKGLVDFSNAVKNGKFIGVEVEPSFGIFKGKVKYFLYAFLGNIMWKKMTKGKIDIRKKLYIYR